MHQISIIDGCLACEVATGQRAPIGGFVYEDDLWTVNHVMSENPWRGWLVLQPRRHIEMLSALTPAEAAALPAILSALDRALRAVVEARKVYVCLFAEAADCQHIHFHIIPNYPDIPAKGPAIFQLAADQMPVIAREEVAQLVEELRAFLSL